MADFPPAPPASPPPPPSAPYAAPPPRPRRLTRSSRDHLWAGVAGGLAEYFELDASLVRLLWVAAAVIPPFLGVPVYILAWIVVPRDDRPPVDHGPNVWHDWSDEFHSETQRLAAEARRVAEEMREGGYTWRAPDANQPPPRPGEPTRERVTDASIPTPGGGTAPTPEEPWWQSERYVERHRNRHHPKSTGVALVALGILLFLINSGFFRFDWHYVWPLIFIGLGVLLLARRSGWGR